MDPRNQPSLLERIYSWENLLDAYHEAASEKWYRNDVTAFAANLEENLISISITGAASDPVISLSRSL